MRIDEYSYVSRPSDNSEILVNTDKGTRRIKFSSLHRISDEEYARTLENPAEYRRTKFRGENLGQVITKDQLEQIQNGTYYDMWIGDYWENNGIVWRIADFIYSDISENILIIVPDEINDYIYQMYNSIVEPNLSSSYKESYIMTNVIPLIVNRANIVFKSNIMETSVSSYKYINDDGEPGDELEIVNSKAHLMSETMVYSNRRWSVNSESSSQLALFSIAPYLMRGSYWLRDIARDQSTPSYCCHTENGSECMSSKEKTKTRPYLVVRVDSTTAGTEEHYSMKPAEMYSGLDELM